MKMKETKTKETKITAFKQMTHFFKCTFVCLRVHSVNKSWTVVMLAECEKKKAFSQDELENC